MPTKTFLSPEAPILTPGATALTLAGAVGLWLGFPNDFFLMPPLVFLWPVALLLLGNGAARPRRAFFYGWLTSFAGGSGALYWLCYPVHDVGQLFLPLAFLCALAIAACLAAQGGLFCVLALLSRHCPPLARGVILALGWYILEYCFAHVAGFPWLALGGALAPWPVCIQIMDIFGSYLGGAVWLCGIFLCCLCIGKRFYPLSLAAGLCLLALIPAYGCWRLSMPEKSEPMLSALFVEGNIDQNQKWEPAFQRASLDKYLELTAAGLAQARQKGIEHPLIIWPETALPFFWQTRPALAAEVVRCAKESGCALLFGAPGLEKDPNLPEGAVFNRAFLLGDNGQLQGYYDKMHLVPFGEYLPQWLNFAFLKALLQGVGIYQEGRSAQPLRYGPLALGMLICYEGIFPWLAQERVQAGANILVDISNDGWFRGSPASRQHLYLTVLRCVEQNRWLLRSTNTGISAVANNRGVVTLQGPQFQAGWLLAKARLLREPSIFHRLEPWLLPVSLFLFCILFYTEKCFNGYRQK